MNYVNIMGGLGNQFFQYTFARYLEIHTEYPVMLHIGFFRLNKSESEISSRDCSLGLFNSRYQSIDEQVKFENLITDDTYSLNSLKNNTFFNGYWQNKAYYTAIQDLIMNELTLKDEYISEEIKRLASEIRETDSVAIHVRRKDYLNQSNKYIFYELSLEYYASAVNYISESLGHNPVLYIFSDDYDYICGNMSCFCNCITVLMPPRKDYEDLYLMTQAKHHIIANSTFSWWGAALSGNNNGITVAPRHWFKDRKDPDLYPDSWIVMDNHIALDKISVIIPAYNVEKYIDRCLKSIEAQTYDIKNLEIIFIDDASTDNTLIHLEAFEAKHSDNVLLIKLEKNGGQGAARNIGLDYASGKYITFVDSDDIIDVSILYKMASKITEYDCDIVECGYRHFSDDSEAVAIKDMDNSFYLDLNDFNSRKKLIILSCSKTAVWGRLYKRDFINNNNLRFIEQLFFEDIHFSGLVMFLANSYYRINETLYYYYSNNDGTVFSSYKKERVHQEMMVTERFIAELYNRNMLASVTEAFKNELITYCTTKAFVDPLSLVINSHLELNEILLEISYFKKNLVDLFPDAAFTYNLTDEHGICSLARYLLNNSITETEKLFTYEYNDSTVIICSSNNQDTDSYSCIINSEIFTRPEEKIIYIPCDTFDTEHLLLKHAIGNGCTIITSTGLYCDSSDQHIVTGRICRILNEYPKNTVILFIETLYYDESDECLKMLADLMNSVKQHNNISIVTQDENIYSIACAIMPSMKVISI